MPHGIFTRIDSHLLRCVDASLLQRRESPDVEEHNYTQQEPRPNDDDRVRIQKRFALTTTIFQGHRDD
ncbi:hypothetical protein E2C01_056798 [Portunus trituberculatus]|uniref:Uncharacterized protein n=1 Tax=Portunus trituberculatus TaxID=210409 RepID=A0A5B7GYQ9_PORTR|nr:hypothetical protein [Portunus trituberculatus]